MISFLFVLFFVRGALFFFGLICFFFCVGPRDVKACSVVFQSCVCEARRRRERNPEETSRVSCVFYVLTFFFWEPRVVPAQLLSLRQRATSRRANTNLLAKLWCFWGPHADTGHNLAAPCADRPILRVRQGRIPPKRATTAECLVNEFAGRSAACKKKKATDREKGRKEEDTKTKKRLTCPPLENPRKKMTGFDVNGTRIVHPLNSCCCCAGFLPSLCFSLATSEGRRTASVSEGVGHGVSAKCDAVASDRVSVNRPTRRCDVEADSTRETREVHIKASQARRTESRYAARRSHTLKRSDVLRLHKRATPRLGWIPFTVRRVLVMRRWP